MGSSKPPNPEMPFGYSFDDNTMFPFPSPTAPAPGPSLLDDNESKFLDSFFDGVSGDNFNYDFFSNAPDGSELGLGWEELPPAFMGTTSSFGQQPRIASNGLADSNFNGIPSHMSSAGPLIPPSTSADVLAAATLLQNGSTGRSHSIGNEALFRGQNQLHSTNGQMRAQSMSQYVPARSNTMQERAPTDEFMRDTFYTDMMFGSQTAPGRPRLGSSKADIRWGSDSGFGAPQGFIPPPNQEKVSAVERYHMKAVEGAFLETSLRQIDSAETTQPSSPVLTHSITPQSAPKSISRAKEDDDQDSRQRKRRKSKHQDEEDDDESPASATNRAGSKRRKPSKKATSSDSPTPSSEQSHRRRKSTAAANAAAKSARENLTEDQKRENHIKSEQKRRTLIREGFEDLGELVPGLRGGGFSKSAVLIMSADWLEDLIQGNQILRRQLDTLQGRG
ncbi:hypothetical protein D0Z07_8281 [Hyphodiscus hymeniophilus]|uniref:BHLH domain-containing protein n=1 Tax=Hyphodiscus hymeniophilus TaxID=353542 RepID=A0A9P6SM79_9HELO|nr:hypothetical protein D0Z07_8281 [Hyphodiscus hymeniophilus]